jgi:hypothetical protein
VLKKEYFSKKKADADHDRDKVLTTWIRDKQCKNLSSG